MLNEIVGSSHILSDIVTFTTMVDGLCKVGLIIEAYQIVDNMIEKGVELYVF